MATQTIKMRIQFRRDTAANWELYKDIVPAAGEPCFVLDKNILKIGDGVTTFEKLEPISGSGIEVAADGKSIVLENGIFKLMGFEAAEVGAQLRKAADGGVEWVVPVDLTGAVAALQSEVKTIKENVTTLQEIVTPSGEGAISLLGRVEGLEHQMDGAGEGTVDAKIDAKINDFAKKISDDGVVNTIKELIDYVANHGGEVETLVADIATLQERVGDEPVREQITKAIAASGHISKEEAETTLLSKVEAAATLQHVKYEISTKPAGTLVDYREKEIRVMCPADTKWIKQEVGAGGNANMYYMGFKAYAPAGAVSFKEGDRGVIVDKMFTFDDAFAGTDQFGRKYSICWLALASYDSASDTWTYFGKNSTASKYIGWTYVVEWYDANGVMIESDSIRINLSNEACHNIIEPYYMAGTINSVKVGNTLMDIVNRQVVIPVGAGLKGSDEISVAEDGTMSIKTITWDKVAQGSGELVLDGGGAAFN